MKQSSIEWLDEQLDNLLPFIDGETAKKFNELIDQAKEMHKQEVIDAYIEGYSANDFSGDSEQYYNDKFKTESK